MKEGINVRMRCPKNIRMDCMKEDIREKNVSAEVPCDRPEWENKDMPRGPHIVGQRHEKKNEF